MTVPKAIIDLMEDIKWLFSYFKVFVLEYYCRNVNKEADATARNVNM